MGLWDLWHNHQGSGSTWYEEGEKKKGIYRDEPELYT